MVNNSLLCIGIQKMVLSFWLQMVHELSEDVLYPLRTSTGQYIDHIVAVRPIVKLV